MIDPTTLIGRDFGGVTLLDVQGRGHTGVVYTGFQRSLKRKVAVKLVPKDMMTAQCFNDEAQVVAVLQHPNIVTIFDVGEDDEFLFITMQLVEGVSFQSMIERAAKSPIPSKRLLPITAALRVMGGVLDALDYAHGENVVHQDVKPGNILIEASSGRPYLVDFGIARTELTEDGSQYIHGTPVYMAPEQARGEPTDARADVYAAGLVLWEALAGKLPSPMLPPVKLAAMKARKPETFFESLPSASCPRIDHDLERVILKAIACDKPLRYESCARFKDDLSKYAESKFQTRL